MNLPKGYLLQNGKYELTQVVGQGGFGITYKGIWYTEAKGPLGTVKTEVPVCIKEYFFKDYCYREAGSCAVKVHSETGKNLFDKFKEKLIKEATILSEVHHPYIVNVLEVFEENETAYIAMEYISGFSLKYRLEKEGVMSETKVLKYVGQVGQALQFVHQKNILHLDIKPSNILVDKDDNARLIDFGVSKRYDMDQQETSTTILSLSKGFASIEQYDNEGTLNFSPCPDIYSLGATMYNLLTGKIPTESILRATRSLPAPSAINPAISAETEAVIIKAMQIIPADRFQSIEEMIGALAIPSFESPSLSNPSLPVEEEEDTTVLAGTFLSKTSSMDDELTEVQGKGENPFGEQTQIPKKRKSLRVASVVVAVILISGSVAAIYFSQKDKTQVTQVAEIPGSSEQMTTDDEKKVSLPAAEATTSFSPEQKQPLLVNEDRTIATEQNASEPRAGSETTRPAEETSNLRRSIPEIESSIQPVLPSPVEADAKYEEWLASGKAKISVGDYEGAKSDLIEAKETKLTEEVVRLLIMCDQKAEEKRLADRKAMYEEKMDFGSYKIVRKKATGRYGAIDAAANERIPCKYLSVGKAENGRAFERTDNLFDIYDVEGTLVSEGVTYY